MPVYIHARTIDDWKCELIIAPIMKQTIEAICMEISGTGPENNSSKGHAANEYHGRQNHEMDCRWRWCSGCRVCSNCFLMKRFYFHYFLFSPEDRKYPPSIALKILQRHLVVETSVFYKFLIQSHFTSFKNSGIKKNSHQI